MSQFLSNLTGTSYQFNDLVAYARTIGLNLATLPFSIRILLEAALRQQDGLKITAEHVAAIAGWKPKPQEIEVPFIPGRVVLQDFTGVPCVVDLASMRDAVASLGGDPKNVKPLIRCDLVVDHSLQVQFAGSALASQQNIDYEFEQNRPRYQFLRWAQSSFENFSIVPPATGIVHQVNLEYLAGVALTRDGIAFPDSCYGTDSHTTMINGLGVVGWGVGGIEAQAAMLGQPSYMLLPEVVGFELTGALKPGVTATDLVLTITQMLRKHGVVGKFVEFFGTALDTMSVADRATIANMAPEYGATMGYFPVDEQTLRYLRQTGREEEQVKLTETLYREQGLFYRPGTQTPVYSSTLTLDLNNVVPSLAGPKRPQDRVTIAGVKSSFATMASEQGRTPGTSEQLCDGSVVIAAITSCTNTSNPSVMVAAGLVAQKARKLGLKPKPWVKTSLTPGSNVVDDYLLAAGLQGDLDALGFQVVGHGCATCIGNSGPLADNVTQVITSQNLTAAAVISGNRNFEGRVHAHVKANYLASPPLVVAYAIAGTVNIDLDTEPLGTNQSGQPVFLRDIWPTPSEIAEAMKASENPQIYRSRYQNLAGSLEWQQISAAPSIQYPWDPENDYIHEPPYFTGMSVQAGSISNINGAQCLIAVGDSVTTDHISPAGGIKGTSPAAMFLKSIGVKPDNFNSYGARRGNDLVMARGTFDNSRLKNLLVAGTEGNMTLHHPSGDRLPIFDAATRYQEAGTPLVVIAGKEYGTGSSRDWAAKGPYLLGIKVVMAESFERIHRSNLVGMSILPLQFKDGRWSREALGLDGTEEFSFDLENLKPGCDVKVIAKKGDSEKVFWMHCRIDTAIELEYYRHGGVMQYVIRQMVAA